MAMDERTRRLARTLRDFQESAQRAGPAASASYALIGAILLFGGIGYGLDAWLHSAPWGVFGGLSLGLITGFYLLAKTVWRR